MIDFIKKYWLLLILAFPFVVDIILQMGCVEKRWLKVDLGLNDNTINWIGGWSTYFSCIATAYMAYLTYRIIQQNNDINKGKLEIYVRTALNGQIQTNKICFINVGNSIIYNIKLKCDRNLNQEHLSDIQTIKVGEEIELYLSKVCDGKIKIEGSYDTMGLKYTVKKDLWYTNTRYQ